MTESQLRPTYAEIDLAAIQHNTFTIAQMVAPSRVCAVLKAFAYGHGPVRVAEAALKGGASWLAVALVEEGRQLRAIGITEPILVLSEPPARAMSDVVVHDLTPTLYSQAGVEALAKTVALTHPHERLGVHLKVDTGMNRVGVGLDDAVPLALAIHQTAELILDGVFTHFAVADEPTNPFTRIQLDRFNDVLGQLKQHGIEPRIVHAANSAAALVSPEARFDMVRCGIALYGCAPSPELSGVANLVPALSLKSAVSFVKTVGPGQAVSYGQNYRLDHEACIATVPIGYADGVPRALGSRGGCVLIRGRRYPIAGNVTMDQLTVDCGDDEIATGDEVVLLGRQGDEEVTAWEWADLTDTIAYEILCAVGARVPRRYRN